MPNWKDPNDPAWTRHLQPATVGQRIRQTLLVVSLVVAALGLFWLLLGVAHFA